MTAEICCNFFDISIMQYNSLGSAVPGEWKHILRREEIMFVDTDVCKYLNFINLGKPAAHYYCNMNAQSYKIQALAKKWSVNLQMVIDEEQIKKSLMNISKITNFPRYRSL